MQADAGSTKLQATVFASEILQASPPILVLQSLGELIRESRAL